MKKIKYEIIYYIVLLGFSAYILADTFFIPRYYRQETKADGMVFAELGLPDAAEAGGDFDIENADMRLKITTSRAYNTNIYVAEIYLNSAEYIRSAFAKNTYGKNVKEQVSATAKANNAILAINGDFYGSRERGYVIRNGVVYRSLADENREALVILKDGSFMIIKETETSADELIKMGAWQVFSFGPGILKNSEISSSIDSNDDKSMAHNPRTAVGIAEEGHYFFVVSDGRTEESHGLSVTELAEFMKGLGCSTAYNLDGGGSSTFCYNGEVINRPTTNGMTFKERKVSDIVYIGY